MVRRNSNGVVFKTSTGNILGGVYSLKLTVMGASFPRAQNVAAIGYVILNFSEATTVTINYGDGVVTKYNTALVNGKHRFAIYQKGTSFSGNPNAPTDINVHTYADGNASAYRGVTFVFDNNLLVGLTMTAMVFPVQPLEFVFAAFPNLVEFDVNSLATTFGGALQGAFSSFNFNGYSTSNITSFSTALAFVSTLNFSSEIPAAVFTLPLTNLGVGGTHNTKTFAQSGFDKIALLKNTLKVLRIAVPFSDAQALPANFTELTKLTDFTSFNSNTWASGFPAVIRSMYWLENIVIQGSNTTTDCGDLSAMSSLKSLGLSLSQNISVVPNSSIKNCPLLKRLDYQSSFQTVARVNAFIDNLYSYVVANAPLVGVNTDTLRGMTIGVQQAGGGSQVGIVSGTYRAPLKNVLTLVLTNGGSGYTSNPTVTFTGGLGVGGSSATATVTRNATTGVITGITLTYAGHFYESVPTVTLSGGGGTGATAEVTALSEPYQQGITNGNPATAREKIWVLVNQYNHTITYRAS
jgi:hypothetical protein